MLVDEIVEDGEELLFIGVAAVAEDDERSFASGCVARRNIDIDGSRPDPGVGRRNKQVRLVAGRRLPVKTDALRQPSGSSRIMPGLKTVLSFDDIVKE